jgi:ferredoxin, 2Fe-2S
MPKITFLPQGVTVECEPGATVFEVGWKNQVPIESACIGQATCGLCRVKIIGGEEHLSAFGAAEEKHLGNVYYLTRVRLSCQSVISSGHVTVELAPRRRRGRGG